MLTRVAATALTTAGLASASLFGQQPTTPRPIADGFGKGAYRIGDGVRSPMPLGSPRLTGAPATTIARDIEIEAVVGEGGKVGETHIVRSFGSTAGQIDELAETAVKTEPFAPGTLNGKPVAVIVTTIFHIPPDDPTVSGVTLRVTGATQFAWNPRGNDVAGSVAAKIRHVTDPKYTSDAMKAQAQGPLEVDVIVQPDGSPGDIRVTESIEKGQSLDTPAIAALKMWTFEPAKQNTRPVPARVTIALIFRLH